MVIDNSKFPEKVVVTATHVSEESKAWQMGHRWNLKLECGHVVASRNDTPNETVKCLLCHTGEIGNDQ